MVIDLDVLKSIIVFKVNDRFIVAQKIDNINAL